MKAVVIGLGLIGGSLALNLMKNKFISGVYGIDLNKEHEKEALRLNLVHEIIEFKDIKTCDLIFLCVPVGAIIEIIKQLKNIPKTTTIIEFGSTKESIQNAINDELKEQFILAHPMAGTEHNGPSAAKIDLFKNAVCVLCNTEHTSVFHQHRTIELLSNIGMKITFMNASAHDHHSAIISHLPHVISFSLANYVLDCEDKKNILHLAGGSFADMSRIAKSSPAMWESVFKENKANVLNALDGFISELNEFKEMMNNNDFEKLNEWLKNANKLKEIL